MKRNSMATERQCNTYNQKTRAARKSSPRHKVKIHHFFFLIYSNTVYLPVCVTYHKGAFIIYLEGGLWWFWGGWGGGHSFSLLWFRGGCGKFPTKITSSIGGGGQPFFSWERKGSENMLLDALIIPVFYFILTKCWYRTRVWNLMHDAHFLCNLLPGILVLYVLSACLKLACVTNGT